jgi:hypothetical protein
MLTVAINSVTQKGEKKGQALVYIDIPKLISCPKECRFQPSMED